MNAVSLTAGRTGHVWVFTLAAAGANLACLLLLEPRIGLKGAALAVTLGYLVLLVGVGLYSRGPDNPIRYEWGRLTRGAARFHRRLRGGDLSSGNQTFVDACIRLAWLVTVPPLLVFARVVPRERLFEWRADFRAGGASPHL